MKTILPLHSYKLLLNGCVHPGLLLGLLLGVMAPASAQLQVDTDSREESRVFYNAIYPASEGVAHGWSGNVSKGQTGNTSQAFKDAIFLRINFFRAYAGLPADVVNNPTWSARNQLAALIMSRNGKLSHNVPTNWKSYSAAGAEAAANSNLALSYFGPFAITSYIEDPGAVNKAVGHRRWILYPQTNRMGTGDIPATNGFFSANSLWTFDPDTYNSPRPELRDEFVAWPPVGFVPYQLIFPRWSFSLAGADFSSANVSLARNGAGVPVRIDSRQPGYGENTITFVPDNLNPDAWGGPVAPARDTTTTVTVSNVVIGGVARSFTYDVISFNPAQPGTDSPDFTINGPAAAPINVATTYSIAGQALSTGYQWKASTVGSYNTLEGAEKNGTVSASVPGGYAFRTSKIKAGGKFSYHLAHARFTRSSFILRNPVLVNSATQLRFSSRLGFATRFQTARVEVSTDGGKQWQGVWSQAGRNNKGEGKFTTRTVSLAAFAGSEVLVRFHYDLRQGSAFTQTSIGVGWHLDNISFTNAQALLNPVFSSVSSSPTYELTPVAGRVHGLQVRSQVFGQYYLGWSPVKFVTTSN